MADAAVWYLVVQMASSAVYPIAEHPPMVGPITETQCEAVKASIKVLPEIVMARCRRVVAMRMVSDGPMGYAAPIFEGDLSVPVGKVN